MEPEDSSIIIRVANEGDKKYIKTILDEMESSARIRGIGISKRSPEQIAVKMDQGNAVIALTTEGEWIGFSYLETWSNGEFVSNSGLIVNPAYRKRGIASTIKEKIFDLSRQKYPKAKIFSITSGMAIMKLNSRLGFEPVGYEAITQDQQFWQGCKSCVNFNILTDKKCKNCLCTAMLYTPYDRAQR